MSGHAPTESTSVIVKLFSTADIFYSFACICKPSVASVSSELGMVENHNGGTSLVQKAECLLDWELVVVPINNCVVLGNLSLL